jgi:flavin reductase (DIM6/NTAB) family NADH-FMN oxidoreductase RutF
MYIDFTDIDPAQAYITMIQTVIPRPIAWVLSENAQGRYNLAPFSYFNAVSSDPPLIMISVGKKPNGEFKDTRVNIEQRRDFVVHIAHREVLDEMNQSSATLPAEESELEALGLDTCTFEGSRLPRVTDCRVAFGCECHEIKEIGGVPQSLILGLVKGVYIDDSITSEDEKGRLKIHADRMDPLARLGASEFMTFGRIRTRVRPK